MPAVTGKPMAIRIEPADCRLTAYAASVLVMKGAVPVGFDQRQLNALRGTTMMKNLTLSTALFLAVAVFSGPANAACVTKAAEATSTSAESAKWFALETMVQAVSWSLWPSFVATGDVPGYTVKNQKYKCTEGGIGVTCRGQATFCKTGSPRL
jgi:hypothetical protein